jgi:ABC-type multidrug transport system ATPase subunit
LTGLTTDDPLIQVTGLRKAYGTTLVLDGVDLAVRAGEAVGLLGPNGAGKTTLLKILATVARPTRGTARVAGYDCARAPEQVRGVVGLIAHGTHLYEDLTALENLSFWRRFAGDRPDSDALRAALAEVELDDCASLPEAVARAAAAALPGDAVLLSPACASLDMFTNYAHRAQVFVDAVRELALAKGQDI